MQKKIDDAMSADELERRMTMLEGTSHAHGTLIKALHDHVSALTLLCERQAKRITDLQGRGWQRGH